MQRRKHSQQTAGASIRRPRWLALHDGGIVRNRLLALILVPLLGTGAVTAVLIGQSSASARAADRADKFIRDVPGLIAAGTAFEQEIVPGFEAAILRNPSLLNTDGQQIVLPAMGSVSDELVALRRTTDSTLALVSVDAATHRMFGTALREARADMDSPVGLLDALSGSTVFLSELSQRQNFLITSATAAGLGSHALQALASARLVATAVQAAASEVATYAATQLPAGGSPTKLRFHWDQVWTTYEQASRTLIARATPAVTATWRTALATPAIHDYDIFLAAQASTGSPPIPVSELAHLFVEDGTRNQAYAGVLDAALHEALASGRMQHTVAVQRLKLTLGCALLLIALSIGSSVLLGRSLTRPLARLAGEATRVSEGDLIDIHIGGPHEVRMGARALASAVDNLRDVEATAAAVAAGEWDSATIRRPLKGPLGEVVQSSVARIIDAVNEREIAQRALAHQAAHDALTDLPNRAQAQLFIEAALHRAQRVGAKTALMVVGLDRFKAVNDRFGHAIGDRVLQNVARRLVRVVRGGDSVARLGGDEFVVLLESIDDEAHVTLLAQRIVTELSAEMSIGEHCVHIGASVGVAFCRDGWVGGSQLMQEADSASYRAKDAGGGRVDIFDDCLRLELQRRSQLEQAISSGLLAGEFVLHYQPVVKLSTGNTTGFEALIRWDRPGTGLIPPDEFIPVAERSGIINDIGCWVLAEATAQLIEWDRTEPVARSMNMAVNISGRHLSSNQLIDDVTDVLARSGLSPGRLILEITETVMVEDDPIAIHNLSTLRTLGVGISIDDFGTGFTSIGRLSTLPADILKIDRSFVASNDPAQHALVRLMTSAAHTIGLTVVAEGIEDREQADRMLDAHIEHGQGYLFSRPQPAGMMFPQVMTRR